MPSPAKPNRTQFIQFPGEKFAGQQVGWFDLRPSDFRDGSHVLDTVVATVGEEGAQTGYRIPDIAVPEESQFVRALPATGFSAVQALRIYIPRRPTELKAKTSRMRIGQSEGDNGRNYLMNYGFGRGEEHIDLRTKQWEGSVDRLFSGVKSALAERGLGPFYPPFYYAANYMLFAGSISEEPDTTGRSFGAGLFGDTEMRSLTDRNRNLMGRLASNLAQADLVTWGCMASLSFKNTKKPFPKIIDGLNGRAKKLQRYEANIRRYVKKSTMPSVLLGTLLPQEVVVLETEDETLKNAHLTTEQMVAGLQDRDVDPLGVAAQSTLAREHREIVVRHQAAIKHLLFLDTLQVAESLALLRK